MLINLLNTKKTLVNKDKDIDIDIKNEIKN